LKRGIGCFERCGTIVSRSFPREQNMRNFFLGVFISILTVLQSGAELPPVIEMKSDAGRGGFLVVQVSIENAEPAEFIIDTGAFCTLIDKRFEQYLSKPHGQQTIRTLSGPCK